MKSQKQEKEKGKRKTNTCTMEPNAGKQSKEIVTRAETGKRDTENKGNKTKKREQQHTKQTEIDYTGWLDDIVDVLWISLPGPVNDRQGEQRPESCHT